MGHAEALLAIIEREERRLEAERAAKQQARSVAVSEAEADDAATPATLRGQMERWAHWRKES